MTLRLIPNKANLLWLEDRESTASKELGEAKRLGCQVQVRADPREIMGLLEEELGCDCDPKRLEELRIVFVIDVMIAGLNDLSSLGIKHSETHGGLNGGYVFVDRILRAETSPYRYRPVFFLSERQLTPDLKEDLQYLCDRTDRDGTRHGRVEYLRKFDSKELNRFKLFLESI
jgi:hypothetical protein